MFRPRSYEGESAAQLAENTAAQGGLTWLGEGAAWRGGGDVHGRLLAAGWQGLSIWQCPLRLLLRHPCPTG